MIKNFAKIVNDFHALTIFEKNIFDVWQSTKYVFDFCRFPISNLHGNRQISEIYGQ